MVKSGDEDSVLRVTSFGMAQDLPVVAVFRITSIHGMIAIPGCQNHDVCAECVAFKFIEHIKEMTYCVNRAAAKVISFTLLEIASSLLSRTNWVVAVMS